MVSDSTGVVAREEGAEREVGGELLSDRAYEPSAVEVEATDDAESGDSERDGV